LQFLCRPNSLEEQHNAKIGNPRTNISCPKDAGREKMNKDLLILEIPLEKLQA